MASGSPETTRAEVARRAVAQAPADLYRRAVESVTDYAIFALDAAGRVATWNPGAQRFKGYTADEIIGRHFSDFYPPEDVAAGKPQHELEVATRDGRVEDEGWRVRKDGTRFWANVVISAIRDERGDVTGFTKVTRDLTDRHAAQEALRQSEERFRLLVQSVQDYAILMLDPQGLVVSWNEGAERIKGYAAAEILGRSFTSFYPQEAIDAGFPQRELERAARDGRFEDSGWRVRKDGTRFWANVVITALRNGDQLVGYAKVTRDLTIRRQAEEQALRLAAEQAAHAEAARRSEELAEMNAALQRSLKATTEAYRDLDQFAYVASHDLKAPLRGIGNLAQWIEDDLGPQIDGETAEHLRLLRGRVQRMEALIEGILTYSRAGRMSAAAEEVDTGALIRETVELLDPPDGLTFEAPPDMPTLGADRVPLQQVFMNLIGNAIKYASAARPDPVVGVAWRDAGGAWEFTVQDNGPGIAPEFHDRIWGIFQTLAARDKVEGTGIGLSVVKKVVEGRGGRVSVESTPGGGATFRFTWPKGSREEAEREEAAREEATA